MPHTMHPHGVHYPPDHDGTYMGIYSRKSGAVGVGETWTYEWTAGEDSIGVWPYHDHGPMEMMSTNLGLFGAIVIRPRDEPSPDVEHTIFFHMYMPAEIKARKAFSAINGRAYAGNTPTPTAAAGQDVAFNVLTLGSELHTFHIHGHRWKDAAGADVDSPDLAPPGPAHPLPRAGSRPLALPLPRDEPHGGRDGRLLPRQLTRPGPSRDD